MSQFTVNLEIGFFPKSAFNTQWNKIEVKPVMTEEGTDSILVCEYESDAEFWSVYLVDTKGQSHCVADLPTKKLANDVAKLIKYASKSRVKK